MWVYKKRVFAGSSLKLRKSSVYLHKLKIPNIQISYKYSVYDNNIKGWHKILVKVIRIKFTIYFKFSDVKLCMVSPVDLKSYF